MLCGVYNYQSTDPFAQDEVEAVLPLGRNLRELRLSLKRGFPRPYVVQDQVKRWMLREHSPLRKIEVDRETYTVSPKPAATAQSLTTELVAGALDSAERLDAQLRSNSKRRDQHMELMR